MVQITQLPDDDKVISGGRLPLQITVWSKDTIANVKVAAHNRQPASADIFDKNGTHENPVLSDASSLKSGYNPLVVDVGFEVKAQNAPHGATIGLEFYVQDAKENKISAVSQPIVIHIV
jgi:hypothetical protein